MLKRVIKELGILGLFFFLFLFILGVFSTNIQAHIVLFSSDFPHNFIFSWARYLAMIFFFLIGKSTYFLLPVLLCLTVGALFHKFFFRVAQRGLVIVVSGAILSGLFSPYSEWMEGGILGNFFNDLLEGGIFHSLAGFALAGVIFYNTFRMIQEIVQIVDFSPRAWKRFFIRTKIREKSLPISLLENEETQKYQEKALVQDAELSVEDLLKRLEWNSSRVQLSELYAHFPFSDTFGELLNQFVKNLYQIQIEGILHERERKQQQQPAYISDVPLSSIEDLSVNRIIEIREYSIEDKTPIQNLILEKTRDLTAQSLLDQFYLTDRLKDVFGSLEHSFLSPSFSTTVADAVWNPSELEGASSLIKDDWEETQVEESFEEEEIDYEEFFDGSESFPEDEIIESLLEEEENFQPHYVETPPSKLEERRNTFSEDAFDFPSVELLEKSLLLEREDEEDRREMGQRIIDILGDFNIRAQLDKITIGPVVTRYEVIPPKGLKVNRIIELDDNIALGIASKDRIRIEAPVFGKSVVGIEVPNSIRETVSFRDIVEKFGQRKEEYKDFQIPFLVGKTLDGEIYVQDLVKAPHLLIAGSTGSGKSVCVNTLINSILFHRSPSEVRLLLVDPKRVELILYDGLPHLITPVIKEPVQAVKALKWLVFHMEERYLLLEKEKVRNIAEYNQVKKLQGEEIMPYIVAVMDEFADLILLGKREVEESVIRLAAMARAVGIHLVLATQRPSADVITGLIKANFPSRIAFKVSSKMESRIILDENGAENLLGKGDMLFLSSNGGAIERIQAPLIGDEEVRKISDFFQGHYPTQYWDEILEEEELDDAGDWNEKDEPLFKEAVEIVLRERKSSASYLQRRLKVGYNRAARLIEMMEDMGIVGRGSGSKPREILVDEWEY